MFTFSPICVIGGCAVVVRLPGTIRSVWLRVVDKLPKAAVSGDFSL